MKPILFSCLVYFLSVTILVANQRPKVYSIICADTDDTELGKSCKKDFKLVKSFFQNLTTKAGYPTRFLEVVGSNFRKKYLYDTLKKLPIKKGDIILFYYAGHGTYETLKFKDKTGGYLGIRKLKQWITQKKAMLNVIALDRCDKSLGRRGDPTLKVATIKRENARQLFNYKGTVIFYSSKKKQFSYGIKGGYGIFTKAWVLEISNRLNTYSKNITWGDFGKGIQLEIDKKLGEGYQQDIVISNKLTKRGQIQTITWKKRMINFKFKDTNPMKYGWSKVRITNDNNYNFINTDGDFMLEKENFEDAKDFSEGLAAVQQQGQWGFVNTKGRLIIANKYDEANSFVNGWAKVKKKGRYNFINPQGYLLNHQLGDILEASDFSEGLAFIKTADYYGFIDTNGNKILAVNQLPQYIKIRKTKTFSNGWIKVYHNLHRHYTFMNRYGQLLSNTIGYREVENFSEGLAQVKLKDSKKWGYINTTGTLVIDAKYDYAMNFSEGYAKIKQGYLFNYIDKKGKFINANVWYDEGEDFSNGLAHVEKDGWHGYINKRGQRKIEEAFDEKRDFSEGYAWVKKNNKWGLIIHPNHLPPRIKFIEWPDRIYWIKENATVKIGINSLVDGTINVKLNGKIVKHTKNANKSNHSYDTLITIPIVKDDIYNITVEVKNKYGMHQDVRLIYKNQDPTKIVRPDGKNHLIIIGINNYQDDLRWQKLATPVNDGKKLIKVLTNKYYFDKENVIALFDEQATRKAILDTLKQLVATQKIKEEDNLLIYYAGHGDTVETDGYWIPVDAGDRTNTRKLISDKEVKQILCKINCKNKYLIIDACYSKGFLNNSKFGMSQKDINQYINSIKENPSFRGFSSGSYETVNDRDRDNPNHSPFALILLEVLMNYEYEALPASFLEFTINKIIRAKTLQETADGDIKFCDDSSVKKGEFIFYNKQYDWE